MDLATVIASLVSSLSISVTGAWWLSQQLITHRLTKDLEDYRNKLKHDSDEWQAQLREQVESALGEKSAERDYQLSARKRLYTAIGPLRFQLLLACRDCASRIQSYAERPYRTDVSGYYGKTFIYRLLRPLAVSELIERQIAYADFAVDAAAIDVLRFRRAVFQAWTGDELVVDHPRVNWAKQEQHVFSENVRRASCAIITKDDVVRVLHYDEFDQFIANEANQSKVQPFPGLLNDFSMDNKPLLWIRLIGVGYICNEYIASQGKEIGFRQKAFPVGALLSRCNNEYVRTHLADYEVAIRAANAVEL